MALSGRHHTQVNHVLTLEANNDGVHFHVECETLFPTNCRLVVWCCEKMHVKKLVRRAGKQAPHGTRTFMPCDGRVFDPIDEGFQTFTWDIPVEQLQFPCTPCYYAIVAFAIGGKLHWHTMVKKCPLQPDAVRLDGAAWYRNNALLVPDTSVLSYSFWFKAPAEQNDDLLVFDPDGDFPFRGERSVTTGTGGGFDAFQSDPTRDIHDPGYGAVLQLATVAPLSAGRWHWAIGSFDISGDGDGNKQGAFYIDEVRSDQPPLGVTLSNAGGPGTMPFGGNPFLVGGDNETFPGWIGDLAELWWAPGQSLLVGGAIPDAVKAKFINLDGTPADLGRFGEKPTGTAPAVYGRGGAARFLQPNLGTGGDFTLIGTVTDADSNPKISFPVTP